MHFCCRPLLLIVIENRLEIDSQIGSGSGFRPDRSPTLVAAVRPAWRPLRKSAYRVSVATPQASSHHGVARTRLPTSSLQCRVDDMLPPRALILVNLDPFGLHKISLNRGRGGKLKSTCQASLIASVEDRH